MYKNTYCLMSMLGIMLAGQLLSADANGNSFKELVLQQPVSCTLVHADYSFDLHMLTNLIEGTSKKDCDGLEKLRTQVADQAKQTVKQEVNASTQTDITTMITPGGGAFIGESQAQLHTKFVFSKGRQKLLDRRVSEETIKQLKERYTEIKVSSASDWKLNVDLQFKNNTTNKTFIIDTNAYVYIEIDEKKIKVPISKKIKLKSRGKSSLHQAHVVVNDYESRRLLFAHKVNGTLSSNSKLIVDGNFSYKEDGANEEIVPIDDGYPISVSVDFGDAKKESPVKIRSHSEGRLTTYDQALRAMQEELSEKIPNLFTFNDKGDLTNVLGLRFGIPDGEKIIIAKVAGGIKQKFSKKDLEGDSKSSENKELRFEQIPLLYIAGNPTDYGDAIVSNCLESIAEKKQKEGELSFDEKFCAALLHYQRGQYRESYEYFCQMNSEDYKHIDDRDKSLVLTLAIIVEHGNDKDRVARIAKLVKNLKPLNTGDVAFVEFAIKEGNVGAYHALIENGFNLKKETKKTALGYAAELGKTNVVVWLISKAPTHLRKQVDEVFENCDKTPLLYAAKNGHLGVCRFLVDRGADINKQFKEMNSSSGKDEYYDELTDESYGIPTKIRDYIKAERECYEKGYGKRIRLWGRMPDVDCDTLRRWCKAGVPPYRYCGGGWTLFGLAVELGNDSLVSDMVEKWGESTPEVVNAGCEQYGIVSGEKLRFTLFLRKNPKRKSAGMLAVEKCNTNLIYMLSQKAEEPQKLYSELLKYYLNINESAADEGELSQDKYGLFKFLVESNADVCIETESGFSPLILAVQQHDVDMVKSLLAKKVNPNCARKGSCKTAICYALEKGYEDIAGILLDMSELSLEIKGSDGFDKMNFYQFAAYHCNNEELLKKIFGKDEAFNAYPKKTTPLMCAAYAGNLVAVRFLVANKENVQLDAEDESWFGKGKTACDYANEKGHKEIADFITESLQKKDGVDEK